MKTSAYSPHRNYDTGIRRLGRGLLSAVIPGLGQFLAGARRRATVMLAIVVVLLLAAVFVGLQGVDALLSWAVLPSVLLALLVLDIALLAFRLFAVVDAYQTRRGDGHAPAGRRASPSEPDPPSPRPHTSIVARVLVGAGLAALLLATAAPHAVAGYYVYLSRDLLTTVFVTEDATNPPETTPPAVTTTSIPLTTSTTPSTAASSAATSSTKQTTTTEPTTTTVTPIEAGEDQRLTILLIGTDAGYGRSGARADSIMVATLDLQTGEAALFGIPRNTGSVALEGTTAEALGTTVYLDLISSLYEDASNHPELAPEDRDPGAVVIRDAVSTILGIPVDYYAVVDMGGFVDLVDAFGGVTLNIKERLKVRLSPPTKDEEWRIYDIEPGVRHLDGLEALAFARSRSGTDDYDRMGRQRCVLGGLLDQNGPTEMLLRFPKIVKAIQKSLHTDIPIERLQDLIRVRSKIKTADLITIGFTPPDFITGRNSLGYNILDLDLVRATVRKIIEHPAEVRAAQESGSDVDTSDCWKTE